MSLARLGADVLDLIRNAATSGLLPGVVSEAPDASPGAALRRLARARPLAGDEELLGFPLAGTRLVHAVTSAADADRLGSVLAADRDDIVARLAPDELLTLVRDVPGSPATTGGCGMPDGSPPGSTAS